ncbi:hypothetical protein FRB98_004412, partial [Tulasnella sp. 332]
PAAESPLHQKIIIGPGPLMRQAEEAGMKDASPSGAMENQISLTKWAERTAVKEVWETMSKRDGLDPTALGNMAQWVFADFCLGRNYECILRAVRSILDPLRTIVSVSRSAIGKATGNKASLEADQKVISSAAKTVKSNLLTKSPKDTTLFASIMKKTSGGGKTQGVGRKLSSNAKKLLTGTDNALTGDPSAWGEIINLAKTNPETLNAAGQKEQQAAQKLLEQKKLASIYNSRTLGTHSNYDQITGYFASQPKNDEAKEALALTKLDRYIKNPSMEPLNDEDIILADQAARKDIQAQRAGLPAKSKAGDMLGGAAMVKSLKEEKDVLPQKDATGQKGSGPVTVDPKVKEILDYHLKQYNNPTYDLDLEVNHYGDLSKPSDGVNALKKDTRVEPITATAKIPNLQVDKLPSPAVVA